MKLFVLTIALAVSGWTSEGQQGIANLHQQGEQALESGDLDSAQTAFQQLVRRNPGDAGAHANLAVVFMRRRDWIAATNELKIAETLAPNVMGLRLNMGLVQFRRGDYPNAIPEFEALRTAHAETVQSRYLLGLCYFLTDRYSDAYLTLVPLRDKQSDNVQYLYAFGIAAHNSNHAEDGNWAIGKLMAESEDSAEIHLLMGKAHLARDEDGAAMLQFNKASQMNNRLPFVHYYTGVLLKKQGQLDQAKQEFETDARVEPEIAFNYEELANICVVTSRDKDAEAYFLQAVKLEPRLTTSLYGLAKLYRKEGRLHEALAMADRAAALETHSVSLHYLRGQLLLALHRKAESEKEMAAAKNLREAEHDDFDEKVSGKKFRETPMDVK